jgi:hypothetical protein
MWADYLVLSDWQVDQYSRIRSGAHRKATFVQKFCHKINKQKCKMGCNVQIRMVV